MKDNKFTNVSDLQDLDRLLVMELLVQRWGTWLSQKRDYWGEPVDENAAQKAIKDHSTEIRQTKKSLGLDKETRDKVRGEDSVDAYIRNLRQRAKEFGVTRNKQAAKAIELFQEISGVVMLYEKCDTEERIQQHCTPEEIVNWFIATVRPKFEVIDEEFRKTSQKMWIRKQ